MALYDESGGQMLGSNTVKVSGAGTAQVDLSHIKIPDYYLVKAYLLDGADHNALCEEYVDDTHTKEFQEFISKTVDDFPDSEVLNLDDDDNTNFAVFKSGTVIAEESGESGGVRVEGNRKNTYTITNATDEIKGLTVGDTFVYRRSDGELLILVVSEISVAEDGTVTITDDAKADLDEVFEYVKIEGRNGKAELDDSTLSSGVTRDGTTREAAGIRTMEKSDGSSGEVADSDNITSKYSFGAELKVTFTVGTQVDVYVGLGRKKAEAKITGDLDVDGKMDASISAKKEFQNLSRYAISPVAGVYITFVPGVKFETEGEITLHTSVTSTVGFGYDSGREGDKFYNLTTGPELNRELNTQLTVYIGLTLKPQVKVLSEKVATASVKAEIGGIITVRSKNQTGDNSYRHECALCYAGEVEARGGLTGEITFVNMEPLSRTWKIGPIKVGEFYWSVTKGEHGKGVCPYISYRVAINAVDADGAPVSGAKVSVQKDGKQQDGAYQTGRDGSFTQYLTPGKYFFIFQKNSLLATQSLSVGREAQSHTVVMEDKGCGENLYWSLDDGGTLSIIGTGPTFDWKSGGAPWYKEHSKIKALYISEGVTYLGDYAFYGGMGGNNELKFPSTLTAIGDHTFGGGVQGFQFVGELHFPDSLTSIGEGAFFKAGKRNDAVPAENVTAVTFGSGLREIGEQAFYSFTCAGELSIPGSVEVISKEAFRYSRFTKLELGYGVKTIGDGAFQDCRKLKGDLTIPDSVRTIGYRAFSNCENFDGTLTIGKNVQSIGAYAFGAYGQVETWDGDGFTGELRIPGNVKTIGQGAFRNDTKLTSLVLEEGVETIGVGAFSYCKNLENNLTIPDSVKAIETSAFAGCGFGGLTLGKGLKSIGGSAFMDCENIKGELILPDGLESLGGFYGCTGLTGRIEIPESVTEIRTYAFYGCTGLSGPLVLPANVQSIGERAFWKCTGLTSLEFNGRLQSIGDYAFERCTGLSGSLVLPETVRSIGNYAFRECTGLQTIRFLGNAPAIGTSAFKKVTATAYYPEGNSTWTESLREKAGPDLTWVGYASVTVMQKELTDAAEASGTGSTESDGTGAAAEASGAGSAESDGIGETSETGGADLEEYAEGTEEEAEERIETMEAGKLIEAEKTGEETEERVETVETGEEMALMASAVGGSVTVSYGEVKADFSDLIPGGTYVLLASRSSSEWNMVDKDNLLYISQKKADNKGKLSVEFTPVEVTGTMVVRVYGSVSRDLKNAAVKLSKSSYTYTGSECRPAVTVTYDNDTLALGRDYTVAYKNNINPGTASVTVTGIGDYTGSQTASFKIKQASQSQQSSRQPAKVKVSRISLSGISGKIAAGKKITLTADVFPSNAADKRLQWTSGNTGVATVSQNGVVSVKKKAGGKSVTIFARALDGSGVQGIYMIRAMKGAVKKITISGKKKVKAGKSVKLKAKVKASGNANKKLKWISSNPGYATVSASGKVKTYKTGKGKKVKITAMATDGSNKKKTVTIRIR